MTGAGPRPLRFVALGDSYTIGTAVDSAVGWPAQVVRRLRTAGGPEGPRSQELELVANLGVNSYTSADVIRDELPELDRLQPAFASLLIGINDVVQGVPATTYEANLRIILERLLGRLPANRVVTVSVPDYTVTPHGADYGDPRQQSREIEAFNAIMARQSDQRGLRHVDIFDLSLRAGADRSLVAADGLHPSGAQYALWAERIAPVVAKLLADEPLAFSDRGP
jgi:lysophospholipase L1-like esterase